jgi:hypothetical protein
VKTSPVILQHARANRTEKIPGQHTTTKEKKKKKNVDLTHTAGDVDANANKKTRRGKGEGGLMRKELCVKSALDERLEVCYCDDKCVIDGAAVDGDSDAIQGVKGRQRWTPAALLRRALSAIAMS